jgi:hypothetical protein
VPFNHVLANRYRDGRDAMGFHADDERDTLIYESVLRCTGFRISTDIFDASCQPELARDFPSRDSITVQIAETLFNMSSHQGALGDVEACRQRFHSVREGPSGTSLVSSFQADCTDLRSRWRSMTALIFALLACDPCSTGCIRRES